MPMLRFWLLPWLLTFLLAFTPAELALADGAPFSLPPLPYPSAALEPAIDATTLAIHHDLHHQAYVANLNNAVGADPSLQGLGLETLLKRPSRRSAAVRNNAGGHWNHSFFWESMAAPGQGERRRPRCSKRSIGISAPSRSSRPASRRRDWGASVRAGCG